MEVRPMEVRPMEVRPMEVRLECDGPFGVVHLRGDLRLWGKQGMRDQVYETMQQALKSSQVVVMNLTEARTVDSRGIGCLARCLASAVAQGGQVRLVVPPGRLRRVLEDVRLLSVFPTYDTVSAASQSR